MPRPPRREYRHSSGAVFSLKYHVIWCVKYRRPLLVGEVRVRLRELITDKCHRLGLPLLAVGVARDHVHVLIETGPAVTVAEVIRHLKGYTSRRLRQQFAPLRKMPCLWSPSYFACGVDGAAGAVVREYVGGQS